MGGGSRLGWKMMRLRWRRWTRDLSWVVVVGEIDALRRTLDREQHASSPLDLLEAR